MFLTFTHTHTHTRELCNTSHDVLSVSDSVELGDDENPQVLVEGGTHTHTHTHIHTHIHTQSPALCNTSHDVLSVSDSVELGDDENPQVLVEGGAHTQPLLVRTPVQGADGLSRQRHILQQAHLPCHAHLNTLTILLHSLGGIRAENKQSFFLFIHLLT